MKKYLIEASAFALALAVVGAEGASAAVDPNSSKAIVLTSGEMKEHEISGNNISPMQEQL